MRRKTHLILIILILIFKFIANLSENNGSVITTSELFTTWSSYNARMKKHLSLLNRSLGPFFCYNFISFLNTRSILIFFQRSFFKRIWACEVRCFWKRIICITLRQNSAGSTCHDQSNFVSTRNFARRCPLRSMQRRLNPSKKISYTYIRVI